jgi:hypothetical protein
LEVTWNVRTGCFCANQLGYAFTRLHQRLYNRRHISLVSFLQGNRQYRPGLHIHGMLGFVSQMRPIIFHLGYPRVSIIRIHPILIASFVLPPAG